MVVGSFMAASAQALLSCVRMRPASLHRRRGCSLCAASPALATSTIALPARDQPALARICARRRPRRRRSGIVAGARSASADEELATGAGHRQRRASRQAWIDEHALRLDIVDANARAPDRPARHAAPARLGLSSASCIHRGRTWRVRCAEEG